MTELTVDGAKVVKKSVLPAESLVDKLVNNNEVFGADAIPQRTDRTACDERGYTEFFKGEYIRRVRNL